MGPNVRGVTARRALTASVGAALLVGAGLSGCSSEKVRVAFRPEVGDRYRYEVKVQSVTTTDIGGQAPERTTDDAVIEADTTVVESSAEQVRLRVVLRRNGTPDRTLLLRFDRAAQLAGVEAVDGLPPQGLGSLSLPEVLPAAAAAPPDRPLSPGEQWKINAESAGTGGGRLEGTGQLVGLGRSGRERVASIRSSTRLPLSTTGRLGDVGVSLEGVETTEATTTRSLADGAVVSATSRTEGSYRLTLTPPGPDTGTGTSVDGTMKVEVRSATRKLG